MTESGDNVPEPRPTRVSDQGQQSTNGSLWDFKASHWVTACLTLALVFVGVTQLLIYNHQSGILKAQNVISTQQAYLSRDQNGISTSTQRAYVTISAFDTPVRLDPNGRTKYWFIPAIKNNGSTSTVGLTIFMAATCPQVIDISMAGRTAITCDYLNLNEPSDPAETINLPVFNQGIPPIIHAMLGPQSSISLGGIGIDEDSLRALVSGFPMFIEGMITYNDIFPGTRLHITKFCYQLGANTSEDKKIVPSYGFCDHWNCADDECDEDRKNYEREIAEGKRPARKPPPPNTQTKSINIPAK
jgi:hypothetical protein